MAARRCGQWNAMASHEANRANLYSPAMSTSSAAGMRYGGMWWIAVVGWMVIIFVSSSQPDSKPGGGQQMPIGIYKLAHLLVYSVLGVFVAGAARHANTPRASVWACIAVVLYAITDEIHQGFVPGRSPLVTDVAIDSFGGLVGILAFGLPNMLRARGGRHPVRERLKRPERTEEEPR